MIDLFNTYVTCAPSKESKNTQTRPLSEMLFTGQNKWKERVEEVRNEKDKARQKKLKDKLPVYTPSGVFTQICKEGFVRHSGFICVDIDAKDNLNVQNFDKLKELIARVPHVAYCGLSVRGEGYFCIIPIAHPELHGAYFESLKEDFERCGLRIDGGCKDVTRKRFVSFDSAPYINTGAKVYGRVLPPEGERECNTYTDTPEEAREKVSKCVALIEGAQMDITQDRDVWVRVLGALANDLGEDGRMFAHSVSKYYPSYSPEETDTKFDELLKNPLRALHIGTLIHYTLECAKSHDFDGVVNELDNI